MASERKYVSLYPGFVESRVRGRRGSVEDQYGQVTEDRISRAEEVQVGRRQGN